MKSLKNYSIFDNNGFAVNMIFSAVLIVVSMSSMVSLMNIIKDDKNSLTWAYDKIQQELILRTEVQRINYMQGKDMTDFPDRLIEIIGKDRIATYKIEYQKSNSFNDWFGESIPITLVETLCTTKHARASMASFSTKSPSTTRNSPAVSFMTKEARRRSFAKYQYFTDTECSDLTADMNSAAGRVTFAYTDIIEGDIHSNTNIRIQGPPWPTFRGKVTTAGIVQVYSNGTYRQISAAEIPVVFPNGLKQNTKLIAYEPTAREIRAKGGPNLSGYDIYYWNFGGNLPIGGTSSGSVWLGKINTKVDTFVVYDNYPDAMHPTTYTLALCNDYDCPRRGAHQVYVYQNPIGKELFKNYVEIPDTTWDVADVRKHETVFLDVKNTWLKGEVRGNFSVGTSGDAYILDDIYYSGIPKGSDPNRPGNNCYFGLVSESKILIKYKYRDPASPWVSSSHSREGIYLYGAFSAQGKGNPNSGPYWFKDDGVFSYEYQHPHGSPIPFRGVISKHGNEKNIFAYPPRYHADADTILIDNYEFVYIDLHRFKFPPNPGSFSYNYTNQNLMRQRLPGESSVVANGYPTPQQYNNDPYYAMYDYPFHNPVGPEEHRGANGWHPVNNPNALRYERGTLNVWGSIAQRRRGFVHRSGNNTLDNPDTENWWDWDKYIFGGAHPSTGYSKNYNYDNRFRHTAPDSYPETYEKSLSGELTAFQETSWNFSIPPVNWKK
jgi:hypothetical protein